MYTLLRSRIPADVRYKWKKSIIQWGFSNKCILLKLTANAKKKGENQKTEVMKYRNNNTEYDNHISKISSKE